MPALSVVALAGVAVGLWLPVFATASPWPVATVLLLPLAWWLGGSGGLVAVAAVVLSSLQCHWYQERLLPTSLVQTDIVVQGRIADFPRNEADSAAFLFRLLPDPLYSAFPENLQLRVYAAEPRPRAGELWQFRVRLKRPAGTANSAGFDRELWGLWNQIHASGYVRNSPLNRRLSKRAPGTGVLRLRDSISRKIGTALAGHPMLPIVQGITVAARQSIDVEIWRVLRDSGTSHLIAISGSHIVLVAAFLWYPGRLIGGLLHSRGAVGDPLLPARILACSGALFYGALAGYPTSTARACLMITIILLFGWRHRDDAGGRGVLCTVLILVLLDNPLTVLSAGFWLSFLAVALLYTCVGKERDPVAEKHPQTAAYLHTVRRFVVENWRAQFVVGVGLVVPSAVFFSQISLASFVANAVAIPAFSFFIVPLSLLGAAVVTFASGVGAFLLTCAAAGLDWLMAVLRFLAAMPGAVWRPAHLDAIAVLFLLAASVVSLLPRPLPGRLAGIAFLGILLSRDNPSIDGLLRLQVLDVGQGLAVLVQTENHSLLYDTGARWRGGDSGEAVVVPILQANGVRALDMLIVSHDDADHSGGVQSILQFTNAHRILAPDNGYAGLPKAVECRAGTDWQWDGVMFSIVHPASHPEWSDNNASCALLITAGGQKILLPGDIESAAESKLVSDPRLRDVALVLAPHHGSRTSSSQRFVEALAAKFVVFSAGYANRWGFPKADIVQRWVDTGTCALTTAASGALEFRVTVQGELVLMHAARASLSRPWVLRDARAGDCSTTNRPLAGV